MHVSVVGGSAVCIINMALETILFIHNAAVRCINGSFFAASHIHSVFPVFLSLVSRVCLVCHLLCWLLKLSPTLHVNNGDREHTVLPRSRLLSPLSRLSGM